jgi:RNA polymerase sigma-54 factor
MPFRQSNVAQDYSPEDFVAQTESLEEYVLKQIANDVQPSDRNLVAFLLSHLDDTGLLTIKLEEVIINQKVTKARIISAIELINSAEPIGVGSFTALDAMVAQVQHLSEKKLLPDTDDKELIITTIKDHAKLMANKDYASLAKALNISKTHSKSIVDFIVNNLNPFPAHAHWGDERTIVESKYHAYYQPDFIIHQDTQSSPPKLIVEVLYPIYGSLNINPIYQKAVKEEESQETKEKLKNEINQAKNLLSTIEQRNNTLVRFIHWVVKVQHDFILYGDKYLFPITQKEVAEKLNVEESTISRAVKGKTVQLPSKKIIPCTMFFEKNLPIRVMINVLIENEDKTKPLSDQKICEILQKEGIEIARRTVAKYRDMEGHLNASGRKKRK